MTTAARAFVSVKNCGGIEWHRELRWKCVSWRWFFYSIGAAGCILIMFESQCTSIHAHETPSRNLMITFFCTVYYISKRFGPTTFNYEGAQFCNNKNISSFVASFFLFFGQRYDFNHILSVKSGAVIRKTINWKVVRNRVPREIFKKPMPAFRIVNYSKSRWIPTNFCTNFRMSRKYFVEYFRLFCERLNIFNINLRLAMKKTWIYGFETFKSTIYWVSCIEY